MQGMAEANGVWFWVFVGLLVGFGIWRTFSGGWMSDSTDSSWSDSDSSDSGDSDGGDGGDD